jgi:hypothetical protein
MDRGLWQQPFVDPCVEHRGSTLHRGTAIEHHTVRLVQRYPFHHGPCEQPLRTRHLAPSAWIQ